MKLWVVGRNNDDSGKDWDFQGVFDTEDKAVAACISPMHFVGPVELNQTIPEESSEWPDSYYPKYTGQV